MDVRKCITTARLKVGCPPWYFTNWKWNVKYKMTGQLLSILKEANRHILSHYSKHNNNFQIHSDRQAGVQDIQRARHPNKRESWSFFEKKRSLFSFFSLQGEATRPNQLVLKVTGPLASGEYTCEITVETPSFVTLKRSHKLMVVGETLGLISFSLGLIWVT